MEMKVNGHLKSQSEMVKYEKPQWWFGWIPGPINKELRPRPQKDVVEMLVGAGDQSCPTVTKTHSCLASGREPHHQLPCVPGAADWSREARGPLSGELRPRLPGSHRRHWAAEAGQRGGQCGQPGPPRSPAACATVRQPRRAHWSLWPGHRHHHVCHREHLQLHGRCWWGAGLWVGRSV